MYSDDAQYTSPLLDDEFDGDSGDDPDKVAPIGDEEADDEEEGGDDEEEV